MAITAGVFDVTNFFVDPTYVVAISASTINVVMIYIISADIMLLEVVSIFLLHVTSFGLQSALHDSPKQTSEYRGLPTLLRINT